MTLGILNQSERVKSTPASIVKQMDKQWRRFQKVTLGTLAKQIDEYARKASKRRFFMEGASSIDFKKDRDGRWLLFKKVKPKSGRILGVKFITITPTVSGAIFTKFIAMQKAASKVRKKARKLKKVSYVVANLFRHRNDDILLLVSLMGWKGK